MFLLESPIGPPGYPPPPYSTYKGSCGEHLHFLTLGFAKAFPIPSPLDAATLGEALSLLFLLLLLLLLLLFLLLLLLFLLLLLLFLFLLLLLCYYYYNKGPIST